MTSNATNPTADVLLQLSIVQAQLGNMQQQPLKLMIDCLAQVQQQIAQSDSDPLCIARSSRKLHHVRGFLTEIVNAIPDLNLLLIEAAGDFLGASTPQLPPVDQGTWTLRTEAVQ